MARYIDADALMKVLGITDPDCEKCEWGCKSFPSCSRDGDFVDACDAICEAPTADVVEVVRCKDCKYREGSACDYSAVYVRPNGYCKWGEKKDE